MPQRKKRISNCIYLFKQYQSIKKEYPQFKTIIKRDKLIVDGELQPSPLHQVYAFKMMYKYREYPRVYIVNPKLKARSDTEKIPHIYSQNRPCLFYPKNKEFTDDMLLGNTIIPWLSLWLYFYEFWYATGSWLGKGVHIDEKKDS